MLNWITKRIYSSVDVLWAMLAASIFSTGHYVLWAVICAAGLVLMLFEEHIYSKKRAPPNARNQAPARSGGRLD